MHSSKLNHSYSEQSRGVQYVQGRLGPQQTSLHNKHPIRKCELLEAQTLGPQVNWHFNLFEERSVIVYIQPVNVKFRLGDQFGGGGLYRCWAVLRMGDRYPSVINGYIEYTHLLIGSQNFQITNFDIIITVVEFLKKKVNQPSKELSVFFGQFFHENHQFVETFEIIIKINGSLILIIFQKIGTDDS